MADRTETVIRESLIARIEQLTAELAVRAEESEGHRRRAYALETALNNVMSSVPEKVREHYQRVLDSNRERRYPPTP